MALTDVQVRQAKPAEKPYALRDGTGLYLEIKPAGKYGRWDHRYQGKRKTIRGSLSSPGFVHLSEFRASTDLVHLVLIRDAPAANRPRWR